MPSNKKKKQTIPPEESSEKKNELLEKDEEDDELVIDKNSYNVNVINFPFSPSRRSLESYWLYVQ